MSRRPEPSFSLWCDWPGCGHRFESGEYTIFGDGWDADELVTEQEGSVNALRDRHWCRKHPRVWDDDVLPEDLPRPYLLLDEAGYATYVPPPPMMPLNDPEALERWLSTDEPAEPSPPAAP